MIAASAAASAADASHAAASADAAGHDMPADYWLKDDGLPHFRCQRCRCRR